MKFSAALALATAASATAVMANNNGGAAAQPDIDTTVLQFALTLEHLEAAFYAEGLAKFGKDVFQKYNYGAFVRQRTLEIGSQETTHVATLETVLRAGGVEPTKACQYKFPYTDVHSFLSLARTLESVGVSAYLGAAALITSDAYLTAAGSILTVEARHQALVTTFKGQDGTPSPFDTPLSPSNVYTLALPFITSCPASNPTLPFKQFARLQQNTPMSQIKPGQPINFIIPKGTKGDVYIHFLNGLSDLPVKADQNGTVQLPQGVAGVVYAVATSSEGPVTDANTIAGPTIITLENPREVYKKKRNFSA